MGEEDSVGDVAMKPKHKTKDPSFTPHASSRAGLIRPVVASCLVVAMIGVQLDLIVCL